MEWRDECKVQQTFPGPTFHLLSKATPDLRADQLQRRRRTAGHNWPGCPAPSWISGSVSPPSPWKLCGVKQGPATVSSETRVAGWSHPDGQGGS